MKKVAAVALPLLAFMLVAVALLLWRKREAERMEGELWRGVSSIQLLLERFAADHDGQYPEAIAQALAFDPSFSLPLNPYTGQPMQQIREAGKESLGDFTYFTVRHTWTSEDGRLSSEIDYYFLVGYSPLKRKEPDKLFMPRYPVEDPRAFVARECSLTELLDYFRNFEYDVTSPAKAITLLP